MRSMGEVSAQPTEGAAACAAGPQSALLSRLRGRGTTRQRGGGGCPAHRRKRPPPSVALARATFPRRREKDATAASALAFPPPLAGLRAVPKAKSLQWSDFRRERSEER